MSSQIGRNDPCPCGSGKKYKNCCHKKGVLHNKNSQNKIALGILSVIVVLAGIISISKISSKTTTPARAPITPTPVSQSASFPSAPVQTTTAPVTGTPNTPQPPGPVPPGKVWSTEHGHWHNATTTNVISSSASNQTTSANSTSSSPVFDILPGQIESQTQSQAKLTPQPPGPVPEGKVWSPEHGHWHNIQGGTGKPVPQPPGPVPEGKVWSPEHGHWHDKPAEPKVIENTPNSTNPK